MYTVMVVVYVLLLTGAGPYAVAEELAKAISERGVGFTMMAIVAGSGTCFALILSRMDAVLRELLTTGALGVLAYSTCYAVACALFTLSVGLGAYSTFFRKVRV